MKKAMPIVLSVLVLLVLVAGSSSFYIVEEDEVAVVKRLSRITTAVVDGKDVETVKDNIKSNPNFKDIEVLGEKGLHFKIPFVDSVEKYSSKYLTYTSQRELINTNDERRIEIEMYSQYRVIDPITFNIVVGSKSEANRRMDESVYKIVINAVNKLEFHDFFYQDTIENLLDSKQDEVNANMISQFGLFVSDISINNKSFPTNNITNIEEKMAKEIQKDSEKLIAEGDSEYLQAQATTDRERAEIVAKAIEEAALIKAAADAEAIKIYQESLQKDLSFYQFIKRMEIYGDIKDTTIFIDEDNSIFKLIDAYQVPNLSKNVPTTSVTE